jgi:hypothetical protein
MLWTLNSTLVPSLRTVVSIDIRNLYAFNWHKTANYNSSSSIHFSYSLSIVYLCPVFEKDHRNSSVTTNFKFPRPASFMTVRLIRTDPNCVHHCRSQNTLLRSRELHFVFWRPADPKGGTLSASFRPKPSVHRHNISSVLRHVLGCLPMITSTLPSDEHTSCFDSWPNDQLSWFN